MAGDTRTSNQRRRETDTACLLERREEQASSTNSAASESVSRARQQLKILFLRRSKKLQFCKQK